MNVTRQIRSGITPLGLALAIPATARGPQRSGKIKLLAEDGDELNELS